MKRRKTTKAEYLQGVVEKYRGAGQAWPATSKMIAAWAIQQRLWEPERSGVLKQCARELADAMREEYFADPQGRRVRRKHALKETHDLPDGQHEQLTLWVDMFDASADQMQGAFQLRRHQILGDCRQLKTDVDSYNQNNNDGTPIQMIFDFTNDLVELEEAAVVGVIP